jgi:hypothetical protein
MMTSRPTAENPTAADYNIPSDPGCTKPGDSPLVDMPTPRQIDDAGMNIGTDEKKV